MVPEAKSAGDASHNFAPGDLVEVCEGELMHLQGKVLRIDGEKVTMLPKHKDLNVSECRPAPLQDSFSCCRYVGMITSHIDYLTFSWYYQLSIYLSDLS